MSLRGDKYETVEEIQRRLQDSVVFYDGKPVYIKEVRHPEDEEELKAKEIARVYFQELPYGRRGQTQRKFLSSRKFDLTPPKLGYFNYNGSVSHVSRRPIRGSKQGLDATNCIISDKSLNPSRVLGFNELVTAAGFANMLLGVYPSFEEGLEALRGEATSVALSYDVAVSYDDDLEVGFLFYRGKRCGFSLDGTFNIPPKFKYVRETLAELRVPVAAE